MKGFYYSTFLLASIFITNVLTSSNPCRYVQDNVYINDPSSCAGYFKCVNGKEYPNKCPNDLWFDKVKGECNFKTVVVCEDVEARDPCKDACKDDANECFVNNPATCAGYYYCKNGVGEADECPSGTNFHPDKRECVYPTDYPCSDDGQSTANLCEHIPNFIYVRDSKDCNKYYRCVGNKAEVLTCSSEAYFNLKSATCDKKDEVECDNTGSDEKPSCEGKKDGDFIKDPKICAGWYRCLKEKTDLKGVCLKDQWFVESKQACEWKDKVSEDDCKNRCEGKQMGFVVVPDGTCKNYYTCQQGKIFGKPQSCETDKVFDGSIEYCVDEKDFKCAPKPGGENPGEDK